jgi:hypothetical protein
MGLIGRLKRHWQRRQLIELLIEQLEAGSGVSSQSWARGTSSEEVLLWYDEQLADSRTPYGLSGLKLAILGDSGPALYEMLLTRRGEWRGRRFEMEAALRELLAERQVTTAVVSFGTALHGLFQHSRS